MQSQFEKGQDRALTQFGVKVADASVHDLNAYRRHRQISKMLPYVNHGANALFGGVRGALNTPPDESTALHALLGAGGQAGGGYLGSELVRNLLLGKHPLLQVAGDLGGQLVGGELGYHFGQNLASTVRHAPHESTHDIENGGKAPEYVMGHKDACAKFAAEIQVPEGHQIGMRVPKGGSACSKCTYVSEDGTKCGQSMFQRWNGGPVIPGPSDAYCCDYFEAAEGVNKTSELQKLALSFAPMMNALKTPAAQQMLRGTVVPGLVGAGIGAATAKDGEGLSGAVKGGLVGAGLGAAYKGAPLLHNHLMTQANGAAASGYRDAYNKLLGSPTPPGMPGGSVPTQPTGPNSFATPQ